MPLLVANNPFFQWRLLATIITASISAGPTGPRRPERHEQAARDLAESCGKGQDAARSEPDRLEELAGP